MQLLYNIIYKCIFLNQSFVNITCIYMKDNLYKRCKIYSKIGKIYNKIDIYACYI